MAITNQNMIQNLVQRALNGNVVFEAFTSTLVKCRIRRADPRMSESALAQIGDPLNKFFAAGAPVWSDSFLVNNSDAIPRHLILGLDGAAYKLPH